MKKLENSFNNYCADRNSHRRLSVKKGVVRNLKKRLFFDKVADLRHEHLLHRTLPVLLIVQAGRFCYSVKE